MQEWATSVEQNKDVKAKAINIYIDLTFIYGGSTQNIEEKMSLKTSYGI